MGNFVVLFSPETHLAFSDSEKTVAGVRQRQFKKAETVKPGDRLFSYLTRVSRWVGLLEVESGPYEDSTPLFVPGDDPFRVRFKVKPLVWLPAEHGIPIRDSELFPRLSFTKHCDPNSAQWTGRLRCSLGDLADEDAEILTQALVRQAEDPREYELTEQDRKKLALHKVRTPTGVVAVTVPDDDSDQEAEPAEALRTSHEQQALLVEIGAKMGLSVWLPTGDRSKVFPSLSAEARTCLLEELPLSYDDTTLKTIAHIDAIWIKGRSILRAFEVEHTTAVYSGILRMADLLALQPNMNIAIHIIAPESRKEKVFSEIRRPVFSLLEKGPLAECCSFISYDALKELADQPHLQHFTESVVEEFAEEVQ